MTDTKECEGCGKTFVRRPRESSPNWEKRRYCGTKCAHGAMCADNAPGQPQTKTCPQCGAEFTRPPHMPPAAWARRTYCGLSCSARAGHKERGQGQPHRYVEKHCDCGADGRLWPQIVEVCEDCRQMWLDDGATLERPIVEREPAQRKELEPAYHAQAHMSTWRSRNGARPT